MLRHLSKNEDERLAAIDALAALGSGHDDAIHQVLNITRKLLEASGCLICLYGSRKIWLRAQIDIGFEEIDFASPLFNFVRLQGEALFCPDTFADERFASDPMVRGGGCPPLYRHPAFHPRRLHDRRILPRWPATKALNASPGRTATQYGHYRCRAHRSTERNRPGRCHYPLAQSSTSNGELGNLADTGKYALLLVDTIDIKYAYEMARSFGLSTVELLLGTSAIS